MVCLGKGEGWKEELERAWQVLRMMHDVCDLHLSMKG